ASGDLTYYASTQSPHGLRFLLSHVLRQPAHRLRVLMSDVGGAFGLKGHHHRENVAIAAATMRLRRPGKWIEGRPGHKPPSGHAREETLEVEAAVKSDGTILGLRVLMTMDHGAYPAPPFHCSIFGTIARICMPGPYRVRALGWEQRVVATNKCQYVAYRGPWA